MLALAERQAGAGGGAVGAARDAKRQPAAHGRQARLPHGRCELPCRPADAGGGGGDRGAGGAQAVTRRQLTG